MLADSAETHAARVDTALTFNEQMKNKCHVTITLHHQSDRTNNSFCCFVNRSNSLGITCICTMHRFLNDSTLDLPTTRFLFLLNSYPSNFVEWLDFEMVVGFLLSRPQWLAITSKTHQFFFKNCKCLQRKTTISCKQNSNFFFFFFFFFFLFLIFFFFFFPNFLFTFQTKTASSTFIFH
jgi:hypothetical protein